MAIWHDGELKEMALVDATSAGVLLGWGVFSTVGIKDGRALWLVNHLRRLRRDAARCDIEIVFSDELLSDALSACVRANDVRHGLARLTVSRRDDGRWNTRSGSDFTITALETAPVPIRDLRVELRRAPELGPLAGIKISSYLPYLWCWREAKQRGWDEAILFDAHNRVVEAARSSVFWVRGGVLSTSPLSSGALDGVGREVVLEKAREWNIQTREEMIFAQSLRSCDEMFLVSGAVGPRSIARVEEDILPEHQPIFERLHQWWHTL
jgi:branched-chain amino acid aminotransferase